MKKLLLFIRILLILSFGSAILSDVLILQHGPGNDLALNIEWYSLMATAFILYFSVPVLIIVSIYCKVKKEKVWATVKKEVILLALVILAWGVIAFVNNHFASMHR